MNHFEFSSALREIGWTNREAARQLSVGETWIRRRVNGKASVPPDLADWVRSVHRIITALPRPQNLSGRP